MSHSLDNPKDSANDSERRKKDRKPIQHTLLVRFNGDKIQFGKITDLSPAGVAFSYNSDWQKFAERSLKIDLFDCFHGEVLEGLLIRVVRDKADSHRIGGHPIIIMENGASFEKLSTDQLKILDSFIDQYRLEQ